MHFHSCVHRCSGCAECKWWNCPGPTVRGPAADHH